MNRITIGTHTWGDDGVGDGKLLSGSFVLQNSLPQTELDADTLSFNVRYPLTGNADTSVLNYPYGTPCLYYQKDSTGAYTLVGKFYLTNKSRISKYEYKFNFQSAVGLLQDGEHYGGIYNNISVTELLADIIAPNETNITYSYNPIFTQVKVSGWLPKAKRAKNLQQLLFACGGCLKKQANDMQFSGEIYIDTLEATASTISVPDSRVFVAGDNKITYSGISKVAVTEHGYAKSVNTAEEILFEGELSGQTFITPKGNSVTNAAVVTFDKPCYDVTFSGCTLLNNEVGANYAVVSASAFATIKGKPYVHTENILYKTLPGYSGDAEKVAKVEDATLVTLANGEAIADRILAYYGNNQLLNTSIVLNGEHPSDKVSISDPFGNLVVGYIKSIDGDFGAQVSRGDTEIALGYVPPVVEGSKVLESIAITTPPTQTAYATNDTFNRSGMVVTATYDDESTKVLENYFVNPSGALQVTDTFVTVTYTELGVTKTATTPITVTNVLRSIDITVLPNETEYFEGDVFNPEGMVVTGYYSSGNSEEITDYTFSPAGELSLNDEYVTVTYTEGGITKTAEVPISVGNVPTLLDISITTPPTKIKYTVGETFNPAGMVVEATYEGGTVKVARGYTFSPQRQLALTDTSVTISFTRGGVTKTAEQSISVISLASLNITQQPQTSYQEGQNFDPTGMVVYAVYSDDSTKLLQTTDYTWNPQTLVVSDTSVTITYTEGGYTVTDDIAVTVTYPSYVHTKSIVISEPGTYHLSDLPGCTHRNLKIIAIGGGQGGQGGMNGQSGATGTSATAIRNGSSGNQNSNIGGQGGLGGLGADGGKINISANDVVLDTASDDIVISIGAGGDGGSAESYKAQHSLDSAGGDGGNTVCEINGTSIDSADGSVSDNGFTDEFTGITYALPGQNGHDGFAGGASGSNGSRGSAGTGDGEDATGGAGGTGWSNSYDYDLKTVDTSASSPTQTGYPKSTASSSSRTLSRQTSVTGYSGMTGHGGAISGPGSWAYDIAGTGNQVTYTGATGGTVYKNISKASGKPTTPYVTQTGSGSYEIHTIQRDASASSWNVTVVTWSLKTEYKGATAQFSYTRGVQAGGGGGAAWGVDGNDATGSGGASGGGALEAQPPEAYGCGGNGGNAGGGGGGGGSARVVFSGNNPTWSGINNISQGAASGGAGGLGSDGSSGAQGCVIIYYS